MCLQRSLVSSLRLHDQITMWDLANGKLLRTITDAHPPGTAILHVKVHAHTHTQSQLCFVVVTKRHPSTTITKETFVTKVVFFCLRLRDGSFMCFLPEDFCLTSVLSSSFAFLLIVVHRWPNYCRVQWQRRICFWAGFQVNDSTLNEK